MDAMDMNNDEVRRGLRESQQAHEAALPGLEAALDQAFDPDGGVADGEKARLLGMPDRRGFLKMGGMTFGLSALAAACVYPDKEHAQVAQTGTVIPAPVTSVAPNPGSPLMDATLLLTALSIEKLAIEVYQKVLDEQLLKTIVFRDLVRYFQDQHNDHARLLATTARSAGATSRTIEEVKANPVLQKEAVKPLLDAVLAMKADVTKAEIQTLALAQEVEDIAAQTYTKAGGILTTPALRQAIMSIGAVEAKHVSVLAIARNNRAVPFSLGHTAKAAPTEAYI